MAAFTIRPARPADAEALCALHKAAVRTLCVGAYTADEIEAWFEATDVDGLNMPFAVSPGDFEDIADMLVPELTRRGRYKTDYAPGTLREKLFGAGNARLAAPHPAALHRPNARARAAE